MTLDEFKLELRKINIDINNIQLDQLEKYYELLVEWNKKINLTTITKKEDVYLKHFYDSLTINKIINLNEVENMCDIGTGAGFPGLVIKILFPNIKVVLVDALNKRIKFLENVIRELEIDNIELVHARVEDYGRVHREEFDLVTSRAVAPLNILLEYSIPLVKIGKCFVAMKGNIQEKKEDSIHAEEILKCTKEKYEVFNLPNEAGYRSLILFKKNSKTQSKYPRTYSDIKKKGL